MNYHKLLIPSLLACLAVTASAADISLTDLVPESISNPNGFGVLQTDKAVAGTPLTIGGRAFAHGLGTHATSEIVYDLEDSSYESFAAWVGVDDHLKAHPDAGNASVVFQVIGDGKTLFDSGTMRMGDAAKEVKVSISGVEKLKLIVTDAGDGISCDHANWAGATLTETAAPSTSSVIAHTVKVGDFSLNLAKNGSIISAKTGNTEWPLSGETRLQGLLQQGEAVVKSSLPNQAIAFTRTLVDTKGHTCTVTDTFTPTKDSIRWEVEILSEGAPWSTALETRLDYKAEAGSRFWTTWGHPDNHPSDWADPLLWMPFANRNCPYQYNDFTAYYGGFHPDKGVSAVPKTSVFSIPVFSFTKPGNDAAFTLAQSPEDLLLDLKLTTAKGGRMSLSRKNYRLGGGKPVRFAMDLVAHPADPRAALGWMVNRYPKFFNPPNPDAQKLSGCAAYSGYEGKFDTEPLRKGAFAFNWKCSEDFPYMGMFLPPVADATTTWTRAPDEWTPGKIPTTSFQQMNDYARWMKEQGFQVLSYFNVTEFGRNMVFPPPPRQAKSDADLWKDPHDFLFHGGLGSAVLMDGASPVRSNCYGALIVDPGDPAYRQHLIEQIQRNTEHLPDTAGIAIDRLDWLNKYNFNADDGVSWVDGKPARSLFVSWQELANQAFPALRQAGKMVWVNNCVPRIEVVGQADGIFAEWEFSPYFNFTALTGVRKPAAMWMHSEDSATDDRIQRLLYLGIFTSAPYPNNNHSIRPSPRTNELFLAYGPLMNAMKGRKWVLAPHCVETDTPGVKVNLFEVPGGGYVVPVSFGGDAKTATVRVRSVDGLDNIKCEAIHPGVEKPVAVSGNFKDGVLELTVPLVRGCAMVKLTPNP